MPEVICFVLGYFQPYLEWLKASLARCHLIEAINQRYPFKSKYRMLEAYEVNSFRVQIDGGKTPYRSYYGNLLTLAPIALCTESNIMGGAAQVDSHQLSSTNTLKVLVKDPRLSPSRFSPTKAFYHLVVETNGFM